MVRAIMNLLFGHKEPELVESLADHERRENSKGVDQPCWEWPWRAT